MLTMFPPKSSPEVARPPPISEKDPANVAPATIQEKGAIQVPSSIAEALTVAKQIPYTKACDDELDRLARLAIKRREFPAALSAASSIGTDTKKDVALDLVNCYAAYAGDVRTAKEAVDRAAFTSSKSRMLARLSLVSSIKPGEGPNEPDCGTL
jgi:hypothetical protein